MTENNAANITNTEELARSGEERIVNLRDLFVDHSYQRGLKNSSKKISKEFKPECAGHLTVGERPNGLLSLIDGQQRREAMLARNITQWKARVIKSVGPEFEASIFRTLNGGDGTVTRVSAMELYHAKLIEGDPQALLLKKVVETEGFRISKNREVKWPSIGCVGGLFSDIKTHGVEVLGTALRLIKQVWPAQDLALRNEILRGVVIAITAPNLNMERLAKVMEKTPVQAIYQKSKMKSSNAPNETARIILAYYNKGLRNNQVALKIDIESK